MLFTYYGGYTLKKWLLIGLLVVGVSTQSSASEGVYLGGDLLIGNDTELDDGSGSIKEGNELGASIYTGYSFYLNESVDLGLELEYQRLGKAEASSGASVEGDAVYINARPKFTEDGTSLYSAVLFGAGVLRGEADYNGLKESESKVSYQLGLEVGYMFGDIDVSLGYRYRATKIKSVDITIQGVTAGVRYNF